MSKIEWTGRTWNPVVGCSLVSPGCTNCYAMGMAHRIQLMNRTGGSGTDYVNHYDGTTKVVNGKPVWTGKLARAPDKLFNLPLRTRKPTTWFVNSMSDLFHEHVPVKWIDEVMGVMRATPHHTYQILTKRGERMRRYFERLPERIRDMACHSAADWITLPLPNVWLGVSTEDQKRADERIPDLLATPAAVRFISAEPLLGPLNLRHMDLPGGHEELYPLGAPAGVDYRTEDGTPIPRLDWVIVGGESGPGARPMHPDWARSIRDQCQDAEVPFFFKQHGNWLVGEEREDSVMGTTVAFQDGDHFLVVSDGHDIVLDAALNEKEGPRRIWGRFAGWRGHLLKHAGKKDAGRILDGRTHDGMPVPASVERQSETEPA